MWEFLAATGVTGILAIAAVAIVVFLLAAPGSEISVLGIRFRKRPGRPKTPKYKKLPEELSSSWSAILRVFAALDSDYVTTFSLRQIIPNAECTQVQINKAIEDMAKHGLLSKTDGGLAVRLLDRGRDLVARAHELEAEGKAKKRS